MSIEDAIHARKVLEMWGMGMNPRRIADETGWPVHEIYRLLRRLEKKLVKEKGVENYGQEIHI